MSTLAVIFTVYKRPWAIPRIRDALLASTLKPEELWLLWEDEGDLDELLDLADETCGWAAAHRAWDPGALPHIKRVRPNGQNPLSVAANQALDLSLADYFVYLTDDSLPDPRKYEVMARELDENPEWGAVYCAQDYGTATDPDHWLAGGYHTGIRAANEPEPDPYCRVDHTQVMHRRTSARWPLDPSTTQLSDAHFFRDLVADLGPLMPVPEVLDWTRQLPDGLSHR